MALLPLGHTTLSNGKKIYSPTSLGLPILNASSFSDRIFLLRLFFPPALPPERLVPLLIRPESATSQKQEKLQFLTFLGGQKPKDDPEILKGGVGAQTKR